MHIVFCETNNNDWDSVNGTGWRTNFSPPLTYWLTIDSELGSEYSLFGDGYVPYNVIIGPGYQVYQTGSGFDETETRNVFNKASSNFQFYPQQFQDQKMAVNTEAYIDLSQVMVNTTGTEPSFTVAENSNTEVIVSYVSEGTGLRITSGSVMGMSKLLIKATAGTNEAYFKFNTETYDPALYETEYENFDSEWLPSGWSLKTASTGAGWKQSSSVSYSGGFSAYHSYDTGTQNDWIITPKISVTEKSVLSFWQKGMYSSYYLHHTIAYSKDLSRFTNLYYDLPVTESWDQVFIDLSSLAGQSVYIGFNYQGDDSDVWFIDDVRVWTTTGIEDIAVPEKTVLEQNYPNPFNPSTQLSFSLDREMQVKLSVYNSKGQSVAEVFSGKLNAGVHSFSFNAQDLNSGVYFCRLEYEGGSAMNKMLLLK